MFGCTIAISAQKTETRNVTGFTKLESAGSFDVIIEQGSTYSVKAEGSSEALETLVTESEGNTLKIYTKSKKGDYNNNTVNLRTLKVYVTCPQLDAVSLAGSGKIYTVSSFKFDDLNVSLAGSGNISLNGSADDVKISVAGSGKIDTDDMSSINAKISVAGSGSTRVKVEKSLKISIAGSGSVCYVGKPESLDTDIAGSGSAYNCK